jgi:predicted transcriptional regulator
MAKTIANLAEELHMTPRNVRKHIRAITRENGGTVGQDTPGKGKRYDFDAREFANMRKAIVKRSAANKSESAEESAAAVA